MGLLPSPNELLHADCLNVPLHFACVTLPRTKNDQQTTELFTSLVPKEDT